MRRLKRDIIQEKIGAMGENQSSFAYRFGFSRQAMQAWIKGTRNPKPQALIKLAEALNCAPSDISELVISINPEKLAVRESELEEIGYLLRKFTPQQLKAIKPIIQSIADANENEDRAVVDEILKNS